MSRPRQESINISRRARRYARREVSLDAEFSPVNIRLNVPYNVNTVHGLIKNMSAAGMFVELPVLYRVGTRFQIRFELDGKILAFYAIVWRIDLRQELEKPSVFGHGMKITTASDDTLLAINNYITKG
jgi:hypothetical protein